MADETPEGYDEPESYANEVDEAEDDLEDAVYFACPECDGEGCTVCSETGEWPCSHGKDIEQCEICREAIEARHEARKLDHSR
jgi:hypothetical protein